MFGASTTKCFLDNGTDSFLVPRGSLAMCWNIFISQFQHWQTLHNRVIILRYLQRRHLSNVVMLEGLQWWVATYLLFSHPSKRQFQNCHHNDVMLQEQMLYQWWTQHLGCWTKVATIVATQRLLGVAEDQRLPLQLGGHPKWWITMMGRMNRKTD